MAAQAVEFADVSFQLPDGRFLLRDVSLQVPAGTTTALLGRSGSGKTTLLRTVNALVRPTSGQVRVEGRDVTAGDVTALRRGIGYVIQETGLFPHMTVWQNIAMPLELAGRTSNTTAARVCVMLERVGLPADLAGRYPWQLSGGQRQRVGLARALAAQPEVLLLDEPFGALDPLTRKEMQDVLKELLTRTGVTALLVTHDLEEALYLAEQVVFLEGGVVQAVLPSHAVRGSELAVVRDYVAATRREGAL